MVCKKFESLCCTPETDTIYNIVNYTSATATTKAQGQEPCSAWPLGAGTSIFSCLQDPVETPALLGLQPHGCRSRASSAHIIAWVTSSSQVSVCMSVPPTGSVSLETPNTHRTLWEDLVGLYWPSGSCPYLSRFHMPHEAQNSTCHKAGAQWRWLSWPAVCS